MPTTSRICPRCGRRCRMFNLGLACKGLLNPPSPALPTMKRPKGFGDFPKYKWAATDHVGDVHLFTHKPHAYLRHDVWRSEARGCFMTFLRTGPKPKDWTKTLRKIKD